MYYLYYNRGIMPFHAQEYSVVADLIYFIHISPGRVLPNTLRTHYLTLPFLLDTILRASSMPSIHFCMRLKILAKCTRELSRK